MAFITLSGTLLDPNGDLAVGDQIRFTHKSTTGETVESAVSLITVDPAGAYSLPLQYGLVLVEYKDVRTQQFKNLGVATVNQDNPATSIPELLNSLVPVSSAELIEFQAILANCVAAQTAAENAATTAEAFAYQLTTTDLIASTATFAAATSIPTSGFTTSGDGGNGSWKQNGLTGQTPSQSPAQLGDALLNDGNGNQWELLPLSTGLYSAKALGFQIITESNTNDYSAAAASNILLADALGDSLKADFGQGCYPFAGSVDFGETPILKGCGFPFMAPFPQLNDDTKYMRQGYKHLIPGCSFLFTGAGTKTKTTVRSDQFSSFTYAARIGGDAGAAINGIAIIMDMDVLDSGGALNAVASDNRSDYNVGLLFDDTANSENSVLVFGYWDVAGTVIASFGVDGNPDYNKFNGGSTMGDYGLALIGNDTAAGDGAGLSGTQSYGFQIFGNDHKTREPQTVGTHEYGHCLFIDGKLASSSNNINGHQIFGGGLRTLSNRPVVLDNCSNLFLSGVPLEFSQTSEPSTQNTIFTATSNTNQLTFTQLRNFSSTYVDHSVFNDVVERYTYLGDDNFQSVLCGNKGNNVKIQSTNGNELPQLQFTSTMSSSVSGFVFEKDSDELQIRKDGADSLTIDSNNVVTPVKLSIGSGSTEEIGLSGEITASNSYIKIQTDTVSNLTQIDGGVEGMIIALRPNTTGDAFTITPATGNIRMDSTLTLSSSQFVYEFIYQGSYWVPVQSGVRA